jgi:hypothetical protein
MYEEGGAYLCSNQSSGGWFQMDKLGPMFPKGVSYNTHVDKDGWKIQVGDRWRNWTDIEGAVVHQWANGWCTVMYEVRDHDLKANKLDFARGGYQTGRSFHATDSPPTTGSRLDGENWRIENLLVELDAAEEW